MPSTTVLLELTVRFRLARGLRNFFTCGAVSTSFGRCLATADQ